MIDLRGKPFYLSDDDIAWVNQTKKELTVDEKLEQLFFPLGQSTDEEYLEQKILNHHPGGILFRPGNMEDMYDAHAFLQKKSKIPMLTAANLEAGGNGVVKEGTNFGKQMQIAATGEPEQAYRLGKIACSEAQAVGCNYAFAPVVDIDMNYHNPITNVRTYGSNVEMVKQCSIEYIRAAKETNTAVAIKHFPGDGVDEVDQHILTSVNSLSCEEWDATFGDVYQSLIDVDALTVMVGHIAMPAYQRKFNSNYPKKLVPATLSKELLQDLLRGQLGFNGMIITDSTQMVGFLAAMDRERAIPYCVEAGCDMILFNKNYEEDIAFMKKGYEKGILSEKRLEEAVTRVLATKAALKLHEKQSNGNWGINRENLAVIGCGQHIEWTKECADKAVTLVKDTQELLPITPEKHRRVLVELMGGISSDERVTKRFLEDMVAEGFEITLYEKEQFDTAKPVELESVTEFRNKYDLVIYIGNIVNMSNKTTNRLNWHTPLGAGNNFPWFTEVVPTMFISLQNPYHLLDVPMIKTYINAYSNHNLMIDAVVEKITGKSPFVGGNPVDPFCGKEYLTY